MKKIGTINQPLVTVSKCWHRLSDNEMARIFRDVFSEASILPNRRIVDDARQYCWQSLPDGPVEIALVGHNELWSVYTVDGRMIAVDVEAGYAWTSSELFDDQLPTLPLNEVDRANYY